MATRSLRNRISESTNLWPGFVDVLATLLIVIIFILMVFTVSQIYLSDAISGRDKILSDLKKQINELSNILVIESKEKQDALSTLSKTQEELGQTKKDLQLEQSLAEELQTDISKKRSEIFVQEQNIIALSDQIKELLTELRVVASALETYEGIEVSIIETKGLGERINKALASRIDQLKVMNDELDLTNKKLQTSEEKLANKVSELDLLNNRLITNEKELENKITELDLLNNRLITNEKELENKITELNEKNKNLNAINESLGLEDANLAEQLQAIKNKNKNLLSLNSQLQESKRELESVNIDLSLRDQELQDQVLKYQNLTNDLLKLNESLGLQDANVQEQLIAIRKKNTELSNLNKNLLDKDKTIFDLRGKILELNNILSLGEEKQIEQQTKISNLEKEVIQLTTTIEEDKEKSLKSIEDMELQSTKALEQVASLSNEIDILKNEINILNKALESSEQETLTKDLKIEVLGERLNKALTSKVFELQKYRSEFFGKLQNLLGEREDIKIVGDRFIFESELLFDSASAELQFEGKEKLKEIGITLKETTTQIPTEIDWIIQVEGHTDKRPINTVRYPSNWELSTARANSVLKLLLDLGFSPNRLSAAGYGEFYPISDGETDQDYQQNRRIELKLTSR